LYAVLACPLREQARLVSELSGDDISSGLLFDALRTEYERLQDVARDTRWRSGSYRHALRHALADLALIASAGGRLEDQAFRLLQQRVDHPEQSAELLELVPPEIRDRYLEWSLERAAAESSPARALFALGLLERYPEAADRRSLERLLTCKDSDVAAATARYLLRTNPGDGSADREIADIVPRLDSDAKASIVEAIVAFAPQRLRLDLWPSAIDPIVARQAAHSAEAVDQLCGLLRESGDPAVRLRTLRILVDVGNEDGQREHVAQEIASTVLGRSGAPNAEELEMLLGSDWMRIGAWRVLDRTATTDLQDRLLLRLIRAGSAAETWREANALYERVDVADRPPIERLLVDAVAGDILSAADVPAESVLQEALQGEAQRRIRETVSTVERARALIESGDLAAEMELRELVEPLVDRAIERSTGNERLIGDYAALAEVFAPVNADDSPRAFDVDSDVLQTLNGAIEGTGVALHADSTRMHAVIDDATTASQVARALVILDQRTVKGSKSIKRAAADAFAATADATATGAASELLHDLFERGPLFQAAVALSPTGRAALLEAVREAGITPPDRWFEHDVLGPWLAEACGQEPEPGPAAAPQQALIALQQAARQQREAEERLRAGRSAARHEFVARATAALDDLEQTADSYVQLWQGLSGLGIRQVATLGHTLAPDVLDPDRHEIVGDPSAASYVVRSAGIEVEGVVVRRARVEAVE
jgi:hypothetical protein